MNNVPWTAFVIIIGTIVIVLGVILLGLVKRIENLESSEHALWEAVNRIGDDGDRLRMRIWGLEHKDGDMNDKR